jgi:hypothetical protein
MQYGYSGLYRGQSFSRQGTRPTDNGPEKREGLKIMMRSQGYHHFIDGEDELDNYNGTQENLPGCLLPVPAVR